MTTDIKPGDQVIIVTPACRRRGPFPVKRVDPDGLVWVQRRTAGGNSRLDVRYPRELRRLEPGQTVKQSLMAAVPVNQRCEICEVNPAPERHFVTVPFPRGFTKVCSEDLAWIKETIRKRCSKIVAEVFAEAKRKAGQR